MKKYQTQPQVVYPKTQVTPALRRQQLKSEAAKTKQLEASGAKEEQLTEESKAKTFTSYLDLLRKAIPIGAVAYGIAIGFLYFFLVIKFFPSGLTTGDTLLFAFIAMGFGLITLAFLALGIFAISPAIAYSSGVNQAVGTTERVDTGLKCIGAGALTQLIFSGIVWCLAQKYPSLKQESFTVSFFVLGAIAVSVSAIGHRFCWHMGAKKNSKNTNGVARFVAVIEWLFPSILYGVICLLVFPLFIALFPLKVAITLVLSTLTGICAWLAIELIQTPTAAQSEEPTSAGSDGKRPVGNSKNRHIVSLIFALFIVGMPLLADLTYLEGELSTTVFRGLGLRNDATSVRLKGDGLSTVRALANSTGIKLNFCFEPDGSAIVSPVNVLWHGLGKRSLISLGEPTSTRQSETTQRRAEIEVESSDLKILRGLNVRCIDVRQASFFDSKSHFVKNHQFDALKKQVNEIFDTEYPAANSANAAWAWRLDKVVVTGHADPMPISDDGNEELAKRRAACLASKLYSEVLENKRPVDEYVLELRGTGSRDPVKSDCPMNSERSALIECHSSNRSATVRLLFACETTSKSNGSKGPEWVASQICKEGSKAEDSSPRTGNSDSFPTFAEAERICKNGK